MSKISDSLNHKNIVCPFCSLHCDDLEIDVHDNKLYVKSNVPKSCAYKYEKLNLPKFKDMVTTVKGKPCEPKKAYQYSKQLIKKSKETVLLNSSSDVNVTREVLSAASKVNAIVDHVNSSIFLKNISIYQRRGYMATSLTEIKNKSDVIIVFSNNLFETYTRLMEKFLATKNSFSVNSKKKEIYVIGNKTSNSRDCNIRDKRITYVDFNNRNITRLLNSFISKKNESSIGNQVFNKLLTSIETSKYLSVLWATSEFESYKECDEIIYNISAYVVSLNKTSRAACLSLSGNDGDVSFTQTLGWMTGFPSRIKFTGNFFEYDKDANNAIQLINSGNSDLVIHLNSLSEKKLVLNKKNKNIVIGRPCTKFNIEPDVFISCGIPGIDFKGHIFRTDNVVSLPLTSLRMSHSRSTQEILREILK